MDIFKKLEILADAAKYDASCSSSGTEKRNSRGGKGIGSTEGSGICHSDAPDGRCISLLKILLTNFCTYDCLYCVNGAPIHCRFRQESLAQHVVFGESRTRASSENGAVNRESIRAAIV